jgi:hypothetical protein
MTKLPRWSGEVGESEGFAEESTPRPAQSCQRRREVAVHEVESVAGADLPARGVRQILSLRKNLSN